ncbi:hypothetical protein JCM10212_003410 [Sporobolomyces blumeae]
MRLNEATTLYTPRLVLRPYRRWHVERYHAWMEDPQVRDLTASERLTFNEELEMQRSWRIDPDKLTFIVHLRSPSAPDPVRDPKGFLSSHNDETTMLGDVNLFLHAVSPPVSPIVPPTLEDDNVERETVPPVPQDAYRAELEIMFPPSSPLFAPRTGIALETLQHFLSYASASLDLRPFSFFVRIGYDNEASIKLFEKLGFAERKRVDVFREVEMAWHGADERERGASEAWPWETDAGWKTGSLDDPRDEERD